MRVFLLGATPSFDTRSIASPETRLAATGGNSGNQIIAYGLLRTFEHSYVSWDYSIGADRINDEYDVIVIAAANFLFPGFDFGGMAALLERTSLPIVMIGLGAQSSNDDPHIDLPAGTRRLLSIVAERSHSIGVRGAYTAEVLSELQIRNSRVTGCPSYYMAGPNGFEVKAPGEGPVERLAIHASRDVFKHSYDPAKMKDVIFRLYAEAVRRNASFIAQTEIDEIILAESSDESMREDAIGRLYALLNAYMREGDLYKWLSERTRVYWDAHQWIESMREYSFVVGSRFHGTIAALHAGTPAVCLCHDSRTTEMCEFLSIPHLDVRLIGVIDIEAMYRGADFKALSERYGHLYPVYRQFLKDNSLVPTKAD